MSAEEDIAAAYRHVLDRAAGLDSLRYGRGRGDSTGLEPWIRYLEAYEEWTALVQARERTLAALGITPEIIEEAIEAYAG